MYYRTRRSLILFAALFLALGNARFGHAQGHVTDGQFGPDEWTGPNVSKTFFEPVGANGGAYLYVEQTADTLYLMYDRARVAAPSSFFDVFFQVPRENKDYLVRIFADMPDQFQALEKPTGTVSALNEDGSFNLGDPWMPVDDEDLARARFRTAIGFGPSPDFDTPHPLAEFELSINRSSPGPDQGFYDPAPAFWSGSSFNDREHSATLSGGIFILRDDGGIEVIPVLDSDGGPAKQPPG